MLIGESAQLAVEVHANGRVKAPVTIWRRGTEDTLVVDVVDLVSDGARATLIDRLPEGLREEAGPLLTGLAVELMRQRSNSDERTPGPTPQGQAVALGDPVAWPDPVEGAAVMTDLVRTFPRYLALVDGAATALALWTLHAHAHAAAAVSPLLALTSPEKRSGKTTALSLMGALVPRTLTAASISPAAVFRTVEKYAPTLLLDEADSVFTINDELRCLFNASHSRAAAVVVRVVGEQLEPRLFSTWCPKAIALIGALPGTLEDRAILVPMRRRRPEERVTRLRLDRLAEVEPLRRQAWRWAQEHLEALRAADPEMPETLHDRAADNWRPLLAIADAIGGPWPARARRAAVLLSGGVTEGEHAPSVQLLADVRDLFTERGVERFASADVVGALIQREDRPWPEWKHGKPLTVRQLARLVARFGIRPKKLRQGDGTVQGYELEAFTDAFARYLPQPPPSDPEQPEQSSNGAEKSPFDDPEQGELVPDAKSPEKPCGASLVPVVPDERGGRGPGMPCVDCGRPTEPGAEVYRHPLCNACALARGTQEAGERRSVVSSIPLPDGPPEEDDEPDPEGLFGPEAEP